MTDKNLINLDAALAALKLDERAALPAASEDLQTRVLADAAMVAAERSDSVIARPRVATMDRSQNAHRFGGVRLFELFDIWSGAAVAAVVLCLAVGLGVGYGAGLEVMSRIGLGDTIVALAADEGDGIFESEDVL